MYKILKIGEGLVDRYIEALNIQTNSVEKLFDDADASTNVESKLWKIEENKSYDLKISLFCELESNVSEEIKKIFRENEKLEIVDNYAILKKEKIGDKLFTQIKCCSGVYYLYQNIENNKEALYISRYDIIQVDNMVHPKLLM